MHDHDEGALAPTPDLAEIERRWQRRWEELGIHRHHAAGGDAPVFSVDTPPPYVSAAHLHVGHAMSYSQPDFIVRYRRMRGHSIFYPIGFDDNGLPTERFVERTHGIDKRSTTRSEFRRLCLQETAAVSRVYEDLWRALGLSVDWTTRYSTIDEHSRRTAQLAFLRLLEQGRIYRAADPVFWDPAMGTALAQADLETAERTAWLHDIAFTGPSGEQLVISTTRPELLPACVALFCHRDDGRYARLAGGEAVVPLFGHRVPILSDDEVDPAFGTGLMMVCTFGDADDVRRWRDHGLEIRTVVDEDGRLTDTAGAYAGLAVQQGREAILADLDAAGALVGRRRTTQRVAVSERSGSPVEFVMRPQWFLRVLDLKDELRDRARQLEWHPEWMEQRLVDWIDNLRYDWNLSRQRYYGVPIPVWLCPACGEAVTPATDRLPVDPLEDQPPGPCPRCGAQPLGDPDVLDTWMTSSLTPQVLANWAGTPGRHALGDWPMEVRVQAHDIIRTWLFYSLVQAHLHQGTLPWRRVVVSGWGLNEQGKRISKRDLDPARPERFGAYDPASVIERHGADAVRHWAARSSLGQDVRYGERDVRAGRKVVLKLWNIARLCEPHVGAAGARTPAPVDPPEDRWILHRLDATIETATQALDAFDHATARAAVDGLLWDFADDWLELAKHRIWHPERHTATAHASLAATMRHGLRGLLGLYAPFLPFVTEEIHHRLFASDEGPPSIHVSSWPTPAGHPEPPQAAAGILAVLRAARAIRTERRIGQTAEAGIVVVACDDPGLREGLQGANPSLAAAARAGRVRFGEAERTTELDGLRIDLVDG